MYLKKQIVRIFFLLAMILLPFWQNSQAEADNQRDILEEIYQFNHNSGENDQQSFVIDHMSDADGNLSFSGVQLNFDLQITGKDAKFIRLHALEKSAFQAFKQREYRESVRLYKELSQHRVNDPNIFAALATSYHVLGNESEAKIHYLKALELAPNHPVALYNYLALLGADSLEKAIWEVNKLLEVREQDPVLHAILAGFYLQNSTYLKAVEYYQRAYELGGHNDDYLYNLAVAFDLAGKPQEAQNIYMKIMQYAKITDVDSAYYQAVKQRYNYLKERG